MNEWIIIQATAQPRKGLYNRHLLSWRIQSESEKLLRLILNLDLNKFLKHLLKIWRHSYEMITARNFLCLWELIYEDFISWTIKIISVGSLFYYTSLSQKSCCSHLISIIIHLHQVTYLEGQCQIKWFETQYVQVNYFQKTFKSISWSWI